MKALSILQPWASLIASGAKRIETRTWRTEYRGPLLIHASAGMTRFNREFGRSPEVRLALGIGRFDPHRYTLGSVLAVAELVECRRTSTTHTWVEDGIEVTREEPWPWVAALDAQEAAFGDFSSGRYGWVLRDVRPLPQPVRAKGALGLWDVPEPILHQVREQLGEAA